MGAYMEALSELVQDFINSYDPYLERPEKLAGVDDLRGFLDEHGIDADHDLTEDDLEMARQFRAELRAMWESEDKDGLAELLNQALAGLPIKLQVGIGQGGNWRVDYEVQTGLSGMEA